MRLESGNSGSNLVQGWSLVLRLPLHSTERSGERLTQSDVRVSLRVDGIHWTATENLESAQPNDCVFIVDNQTGTVKFGDGIHGRSLPKDIETICAYYSTGSGSAGNMHSNSDQGGIERIVYLDIWTREVTAIEDVQVREPIHDGPDTSTRGHNPKPCTRK